MAAHEGGLALVGAEDPLRSVQVGLWEKMRLARPREEFHHRRIDGIVAVGQESNLRIGGMGTGQIAKIVMRPDGTPAK